MTETDCYTTRTVSEKADKEQVAIERLKTALEMSLAVYGLPLVVTTSGGKDSSVCVALAERARIPFEVMHNHTTADAPETVRFVREDFRRLDLKGVKCIVTTMPTVARSAQSCVSRMLRDCGEYAVARAIQGIQSSISPALEVISGRQTFSGRLFHSQVVKAYT